MPALAGIRVIEADSNDFWSNRNLLQEYAGLGGDANFVKAEQEGSVSRSLGGGYVSRIRSVIYSSTDSSSSTLPVCFAWSSIRTPLPFLYVLLFETSYFSPSRSFPSRRTNFSSNVPTKRDGTQR